MSNSRALELLYTRQNCWSRRGNEVSRCVKMGDSAKSFLIGLWNWIDDSMESLF